VDAAPPVWRLATMAAVLAATPTLAACGSGGSDAGEPVASVAQFGLGRGAPEEQEFVLTPSPGPPVEFPPAPYPGPPLTPSPLDDELLDPSPAPPATSPAPGPTWSFEPSVAWVNDGRYLGVITFGSSSCPSGPHAIAVVADQEIDIRLGQLPVESEVCTADMSGHVTVVELPDGITPTKPLVARFDDQEVTIPAVDG
jgi:hypothetical protein